MSEDSIPKMKKYAVAYQKTRIMVPYPRNPRRGICKVCKRRKGDGEIKRTQLHHTHYQYETKTVKANPLLALDNTIEACFPCHQVLDGFRALLDMAKEERVVKAFKVLPKHQQIKFIFIARQINKWWENGGRNHK